jgi:hypothetical protein
MVVNIADIKKELSGDEKVLESAFKLETLYKKYKFIIWAIIIGLILFFVVKNVMESMKESRLIEANEAYLTLEKKADDTKALAILKEKNPALFELFSYAQANKNKDAKTLSTLANSSDAILSDMSAYSAAVLENRAVDSTIYKEMAIIEEAYLAIKADNKKLAKDKLTLIDEKSPLYNVASFLKHLTIKAK